MSLQALINKRRAKKVAPQEAVLETSQTPEVTDVQGWKLDDDQEFNAPVLAPVEEAVAAAPTVTQVRGDWSGWSNKAEAPVDAVDPTADIKESNVAPSRKVVKGTSYASRAEPKSIKPMFNDFCYDGPAPEFDDSSRSAIDQFMKEFMTSYCGASCLQVDTVQNPAKLSSSIWSI